MRPKKGAHMRADGNTLVLLGDARQLLPTSTMGGDVASAGVGVNDAAALAPAHVSVARGGGTKIAAASADMILLSEHLPHLAEAVRVASKTLRIIRQNMAWGVGYNLVALP